mgnify:FL=1
MAGVGTFVGASTAAASVAGVGLANSLIVGIPVRRHGDSPAARLIRRKGDTMILRRAGEATTITLKGKLVTTGTSESLGGTAQQRRNAIRIGPTEIESSAWSDPWPLATDAIEVEGRSKRVLTVEPLRVGTKVHVYLLTVAG